MKKYLFIFLIFVLSLISLKPIYGSPQIEVSGYKINPQEIYPGGEFTLTLNIKNISSKDKAQNIVVEIKKLENRSDLFIFYPKNKTNTRKIEELDVNKEITVDFRFQVDKEAQTGIYRVVINL
ncbi:MAG: hypothetical protein H5U37_00475, partial [Caldisericia bacterium]|nr:hypothetical protein [Caldisericia bacterium]